MPTVPHKPPKGQRLAASKDHISTRLDAATIARIDAIAPFVTPPGAEENRSMAVRACILTGLDVLEKKHGVSR